MPSYAAEIYARLPLDLHVILFTACLLALVILVFGLIPAVRISDVELAPPRKRANCPAPDAVITCASFRW